MPILDCSVKNCIHNTDSKCQLEQIKVEGSQANDPTSTACGSFELRRSDASYSNCAHTADPTSDIKCEATHCKFNDNMKCHADHISIGFTNACTCGETACESFRQKVAN